jgi:hypothetical protein
LTDESKESKLKTELREYQKKTYDAFEKEELEVPDNIRSQKMFVDDFLRKVKEDKQPIQKIIQTIKRIPKVERDPKTGKAEKKDFLEVNSQLLGKDWKDNPLRVTDYYDGFHYEPIIKTTTGDMDAETGDFITNKQHQSNKKVYDIELTDKNRKQVIEDMINNATGTYRDEIKFYYDVPDSNKGMGFRCGIYTFDTWLNSSLDELENLARTTVSPLHSAKDKKDYMQ